MDVTPVNVVFDYTNFLGECSDHHWTFVEVFGLSWPGGRDENETRTPEQKLWESAMHKMSLQYSDEENIIELIKLAKKLPIGELKLIMPYELLTEQLRNIESQSQVHLNPVCPDEFVVDLTD